MARLQEDEIDSKIKSQNQCRLCMNLASELCGFAIFIEETRTVQDVIRTMLSIEDDPHLPQQICIECSRELLHVARIKECWVANQFALARQAASMSKFTPDEAEHPSMFVQIDENVSDSEVFLDRVELEEPKAEAQESKPDIKALRKKKKRPTKKLSENCKFKFKCTKCRITFETIEEKNEHTRQHFKCKFCFANFLQMNDLRRHLRKHTNERPYACPHCTQSFQRLEHLNSHVRLHSGPGSHPCTMCEQKFLTEEDLTEHKNCSHVPIARPTSKQERLLPPVETFDEPSVRASFVKEEPMMDYSEQQDD